MSWEAVIAIFLIAVLTWNERANLKAYRIDNIALGLLISSVFIITFQLLVRFANPTLLFFLIILEVFALILIIKRVSLRPNFVARWILIGLASSILISAIAYFPFIYNFDILNSSVKPEPILLSTYILAFLYQVTHAAIREEALFRGYLWGVLRRLGFRNSRIWLFQALFFWFFHLAIIDNTYFFFIGVPLIGLFLGYLSWKSGSIIFCGTLPSIYFIGLKCRSLDLPSQHRSLPVACLLFPGRSSAP